MGTGLPYLSVFVGNAGNLMMVLVLDDDVVDDDDVDDDDDNRNDNISEIEQDSYGAAQDSSLLSDWSVRDPMERQTYLKTPLKVFENISETFLENILDFGSQKGLSEIQWSVKHF